MSNLILKEIQFQDKKYEVKEIGGIFYFNATQVVKRLGKKEKSKYLRNFLSSEIIIRFNTAWEKKHNPLFIEINGAEFRTIYEQELITPEFWIDHTKAIGIKVKKGRNGHVLFNQQLTIKLLDNLCPEFGFFILEELDRLYKGVKEKPKRFVPSNWRQLTPTEEIAQRKLVAEHAPEMTEALKEQRGSQGKETKFFHYSKEFDLINKLFFGETHKQWQQRTQCTGSQRDYVESLEDLRFLDKLQLKNTNLIEAGLSYDQRKFCIQKAIDKHKAKKAMKLIG